GPCFRREAIDQPHPAHGFLDTVPEGVAADACWSDRTDPGDFYASAAHVRLPAISRSDEALAAGGTSIFGVTSGCWEQHPDCRALAGLRFQSERRAMRTQQ